VSFPDPLLLSAIVSSGVGAQLPVDDVRDAPLRGRRRRRPLVQARPPVSVCRCSTECRRSIAALLQLDQEIEEVRTHLTVEDPPRVVLLCLDLSRGSVSFSLERVCHPDKRPDRILRWGGGHLTLHEVLGKLMTQLVAVGIDIRPRSASFRVHPFAAIERAEEIEERG
jgi:hypothetical protein